MKYTLVFLALFFVYSIVAKKESYDEIVEDDDDETIPDEVSFQYFENKYLKKYGNAKEKNKRSLIYAKNRKIINEHKKKFKNSKIGYNLRINEFSDYTTEEFSQLFTGLLNNRPQKNFTEGSAISRVRRQALPTSYDYRIDGAVSAIQNQGPCGSCYSFAAIATLESHVFLKTGALIKLSEQHPVSCSGKYNYGCNGGWVDSVYQYFIEIGYVALASGYPYTSGSNNDAGTCLTTATKSQAKVSSYRLVAPGEDQLQEALLNYGPITVAIDASQPTFQHFGSGIYYDPNCRNDPTGLNHAIVVIGYATSSTNGAYWIIKNSWGTSWGYSGFARMARNKDNNCGIATDMCYPILS